jgi:hypothetical protein
MDADASILVVQTCLTIFARVTQVRLRNKPSARRKTISQAAALQTWRRHEPAES